MKIFLSTLSAILVAAIIIWFVVLAHNARVAVASAIQREELRKTILEGELQRANAPVIQLAMLNTVGGTRGMERNELATLQGTWKENPVRLFFSARELEAWEKNWPSGDGRPAAKIIYDPAAGEVRVSGRSRGKFFQKTFPVEKDMATTLQQVRLFIREQ